MDIFGIETKLSRIAKAQSDANKLKAVELILQLEIAKAEGRISNEQYEKLGEVITEAKRNTFSI